jgi:hypothetical protein
LVDRLLRNGQPHFADLEVDGNKVNLLSHPRSLTLLRGAFMHHFTPCRSSLACVVLPP